MASERMALLFLPPWEPIKLRTDRAVVIGRSPACDLPIASPQVSRRHAWVHSDGPDFVVADLGSTNGTYVNEKRVLGTRALQSGDRIRCGDHVVTYAVVDPSMTSAGLGDTQEETMVFSGDAIAAAKAENADGGALRGDLEQIPAFAVLQVLEMGGKTGMLEIVNRGDVMRIWIENGAPVHADHGAETGVTAVIALASTRAGRFAFRPGDTAPDRTLRVSMPELLLEVTRQMDEAVRN